MALLMFMSPISSLAMQLAMSEAHTSHCQGLGTDSHSHQHKVLESAQCTMENCADACASSQHCSSPAPIILTRADHQGHLKEQKLALESVADSHLSIHPPGLYRPPRA